ncbi:hypothetical protein PV327_001952 [Microctonus hyperodae]|uniref:Nucleoporin NSP1-like C-terminal domain-containing protein n=1 Tax=Microctonus hyperodae TaxID=165561 RepID=A0AA39FEJ6_MICHY|nr:hypothetical protein PV327_001952 [Microctonus hyperodae]
MQQQPKPGGFFAPPLTGTTTSTFGSGLSLGNTTTQATATPATGLTFNSGATTAPATGLSFGMTTSTPVTGFGASNIRMPGATNFASPLPASTGAPTLGSSFGNANTAATTSSFLLGATTTNTTAPGLTFGTPATSLPASTGFNLGGNAATTSAPLSMSFGLMSTPAPASTSSSLTTSTPAGLNLGGAAISAPASTPGFSLSTTTSVAPLTSTFSLGAPAATTTSSLGTFSLPGTTSTSAITGFNIGNPTTTNTTGFSLNKTTTAAPTSSAPTSTAPQTSLGSVTTVSASSSSGQTGTMNFCQLEESINKWTLELEEQEKVFMNQAAQVNAWDKLLITNGEKIVTLNQEVERVKLEQQQLEHELDYVVGQQKELQDCLVPLEKELVSLSVSDPEREYTYRLAEKLDTQFKQMSEDLKEIIEHLNEANRAQDSSDPIVQIGKILNAHMNSLQWLDQRTAILEQNIQQIDQMHQNFRQENERSFSLAYN